MALASKNARIETERTIFSLKVDVNSETFALPESEEATKAKPAGRHPTPVSFHHNSFLEMPCEGFV